MIKGRFIILKALNQDFLNLKHVSFLDGVFLQIDRFDPGRNIEMQTGECYE